MIFLGRGLKNHREDRLSEKLSKYPRPKKTGYWALTVGEP